MKIGSEMLKRIKDDSKISFSIGYAIKNYTYSSVSKEWSSYA